MAALGDAAIFRDGFSACENLKMMLSIPDQLATSQGIVFINTLTISAEPSSVLVCRLIQDSFHHRTIGKGFHG